MVYNFNLGIGWASSGVEYAQAYRAKVLRSIGQEAKFVFTDMFPKENIQHMTQNIGFLDSEVIWLYTFFSDCKISPVTFTLKQLEKTFGKKHFTCERKGDTAKYTFPGVNGYYMVYLVNKMENRVHRVEIVSNGCLIRKDYYTYCRIYSEYYVPVDGQAHLYLRRFFNQDGSVAYEEVAEGDRVLYKFPDRVLFSREELLGYMMSQMNLTRNDTVIIDLEPGMIEKAAFILNAASARVGLVMHAEHFWNQDAEHVLWYDIYEYAFAHPEKISFFITNTDAQRDLLREQMQKYKGICPDIITIPVVGLPGLRKSQKPRRKFALLSVGRLAPEKRMNQVIEAVVKAREKVPELSLDIYGEGGERGNLQAMVEKLGCGDYVHLCGFQKLDEVYQEYEAYVSASYVETLGVTLLEAIGSGLPIVGYDMRYGAQMFIDEGENGYKVPWEDVEALAEGIVRLFTEADFEAFRRHSYEKAGNYLEKEVERKWQNLLC